ncbi:uncharacterized protein LOC115006929 [Cottoperca gobio]|uniref:Uncharacterized protein LOC115006929 n=1 Tax=Cottoperca gobio TaxID=56716 RepID=A0A6J2PH65_COTGO|nr:uncharacterized protein LOC115006929 [Cottoperca gobio]
MSESTTEATEIKTWTKEDVHHWLLTEVKVHQTCADTFIEEEVSGEVLDDFEKADILDLIKKHGPAVKISFYLERLKEGSQHESQFSADVENWTKEQVTQWLLQRVKVDGKKAERFQEEDVSGDCLVCFRKQDFLDLELKKGPAVKILKELGRLKNKELHPVRRSFRWSFRTKNKQENKKTNMAQEKPPEKDELPTSRETKRKENPAPLIKNILDKLSINDVKSFLFELKHYTDSEYKPIPLSKLEGKDAIDIAMLVTDYYGCDKALCVTRDVLQNMNQRELVSQLQSHMGQMKLHQKYCVDEDTVKSDSSFCSRSKHQEREEKNVSCFMDVKITLPSCMAARQEPHNPSY